MGRRLTIAGAALIQCAAALSGCSHASRETWADPAPIGGAPATTAALPAAPSKVEENPTPGPVILARTTLTNQTGTRVRVLLAVVEVPKDASAPPKWWWGDEVVLTATTSQAYELRARMLDAVPPGASRSVLIRVESLLGTRVETTAWFNLIGLVPKRIDFVREPKGDDVLPACFPPSTIEPLAKDLWPSSTP